VLVVEDEVLVAMEIAHVLRNADFEVLGPAKAVAQALSLIEQTGCDAAVLDINLSGETSEPVARKLLANGTRFVTLSGYSRVQHPPVFADVPALAKPLRPALLIAEIKRCLASMENRRGELTR
jgi:DNA-binding response OmpR family regulator